MMLFKPWPWWHGNNTLLLRPLLLPLLLQVTNTPWGERVSFVFNPAGDVSPKALHVSPFMDMDNSW
jgi:DUF1365 family protein